MAKVTSPLFAESASGPVAGIGSFRMGKNGPEFIAPPKTRKDEVGPQLKMRHCFAAAKAAYSLVTPTKVKFGKEYRLIRLPRWPDFFRQWLIDHPECQA